MKPRPIRRLMRWLFRGVKRGLKWLAILAMVAGVLLMVLMWLGVTDRWARSSIVRRLEQMTGGQVELKAFRFHTFSLRAELDDLVVQGREPAGQAPFFRAEHLLVDIRVESWWSRKISLEEVRVVKPQVAIRVDQDGRSNVPAPAVPPVQPGKPWRERIFDLVIRQLRIEQGEVRYNDARVPLAAEGGELRFALDYAVPENGKPAYEGDFEWKQAAVAARTYLPFRSDLAAKFSLTRDDFTLREFRWKLPQSELTASAALASFTEPAWKFGFGGRLQLAELGAILHKPRMPRGTVVFTGEGTHAKGALDVRGRYTAREIALALEWFRASGIESSGNYRADRKKLAVSDFRARVLGGALHGRVDLDYAGMKFRTETQIEGMSVAALLDAVTRPGFPVNQLHWDGTANVESITTWTQDFKRVDSRGRMSWSPENAAEGTIPATAQLNYHYAQESRFVELRHSEIATAASRMRMDGRLGAADSALAVQLETRDLAAWSDFIHAIRGPQAERTHLAGRAEYAGSVDGPLGGPTFRGHVKGFDAAWGALLWDQVEGELIYSPRELRFARARAQRGNSLAVLDLRLELDHWSFRPASAWSLEAEFLRAPIDGLQSLAGTSYPVTGLLTGQFRGSGTREAPSITGLVDVAEVTAWGFHSERARGQLLLDSDELRINNAEIRKSTGRITGNFRYGFTDGQVEFALAGAVVPLEQIEHLSTPRLPLGGQLNFQLRGGGPLGAPKAEGSLRIVDLRVGEDVLGSIEARLAADGRNLKVELSSAMPDSSVSGTLEMTLGGEYPLRGDLTLAAIDLDSFIGLGLHLQPDALTGHSRVDGRFVLSGFLARPETLTVDANLTRLTFVYRRVTLENAGPVRLSYRREEIRIDQAHLRGTDTDFQITGSARFTGDRQLDLRVSGGLSLLLLKGFFPNLEARGSAQVNATIEGTLDRPRINGRMHVENAAATFTDFPTGLSRLTGDFVFDRSRLLFEKVTAEAGGGTLALSGTLTYGEGPLRYDIGANATNVRIRYPAGMSWLGNATLRFSGTTQAAVLSGRIVVRRLLMSSGVDLTAFLGIGPEGAVAPRTSSPFLRHLQFDIEAVTSPDSKLEWSAARFDNEARIRVRGTWEQPILLGSIRLLAGELSFRGNRYTLTRGDINFSNPFRIEPVLNVEATTRIQQYDISVSFTGPASKLTLAYRSDPPLPPNDIVTLLALGTTERETGSTAASQSPEAGAGALLSEAISSQLGGRLERLFGIRRFRIDPLAAGVGGQQNATARLTIEQQVARDLVITYSTTVSSTERQVVQVEYLVSRDISIVGLRDQNGTFGLDFKIKKRFQ